VWCTSADPSAPAWIGAKQVRAPTLFDSCREAGLASAAVLGDHTLHSVLRANTVDRRWPPTNCAGPTDDTLHDAHGYATNLSVRPALLDAVRDPQMSFVFGHLNETDTLGHVYGPHDPLTLDCCAQTDAQIGEVFEALEDDWERSLVVIVSDHGMAPRTSLPSIKLLENDALADVVDDVWADGAAALVRLHPGIDAATGGALLLSVNGVTTFETLDHQVLVVGAEPGRVFVHESQRSAGFHGGPSTARTLAAVAGGHPLVTELASALAASQPRLADWAARIARVLGLAHVIGRDAVG
jgi:predicted AlkP superfamily pyrophosphatase or phosphodiesterase